MEINQQLVCPKCKSKKFTISREVTYAYSYKFNSEGVTETSATTEALPFLFKDRKKTRANDFIECDNCSARYPVSLDKGDKHIDLTILEKAIRSDFVENPDFLG